MAAKKKVSAADKCDDIKKDLLDQLERNGTVGTQYTDLIEDYMSLWATKTMLINDIKERGVITEYNNGGGQSGKKKNDSVELLLKVNGQMLKLLDSLNIKASQSVVEDDDEL